MSGSIKLLRKWAIMGGYTKRQYRHMKKKWRTLTPEQKQDVKNGIKQQIRNHKRSKQNKSDTSPKPGSGDGDGDR